MITIFAEQHDATRVATPIVALTSVGRTAGFSRLLLNPAAKPIVALTSVGRTAGFSRLLPNPCDSTPRAQSAPLSTLSTLNSPLYSHAPLNKTLGALSALGGKQIKTKEKHMKPLTHIFLIIMMLLCIIPFTLSAQTANNKAPIWDIITPLVLLIASPLVIRLFKKLGIDLTKEAIDPILVKIMELIAKIEQHAPDDLGGESKKESVVELTRKSLSPKELKLIKKRYGTIETAVQAAFESSTTAMKF